jgi:DNA-binding LacI/PurR family transcriptional regulator
MPRENPKLASQRRDMILSAVRAHGTIRLADLVDLLGVSAVTVRRDVTMLADRGLVVRVHGGITLPRRTESAQAHRGPHSLVGHVSANILVGMVAPSIEYYWPTVIQGAQTAIAATGGRLLLRASSYDPIEDRRRAIELLDRGVQTLLVAPTVAGRAGVDLLRWLGGLTIPVVLVERLPPPELPTIPLDAAVTDHAIGAGLAVRHLTTFGHARIGLVLSSESPHSPQIRAGWRTAVTSLGLPVNGIPVVDVPPYGSPGWSRAADSVLDQCRRTGTRALVVHADREAIGVLERAQDNGMRVPEELAVVSYDDEVAAASDPPLTAVRPQKHRLGVLAAELALARLGDPVDRPVHRIVLWPTLMVRESCGTQPMT